MAVRHIAHVHSSWRALFLLRSYSLEKKKHMETIVDIAALSTICTHIDGHARFLVEKRQPRV